MKKWITDKSKPLMRWKLAIPLRSTKSLKEGKAKIMGMDVGRLLDNVMEEYESLLLLTSLFPSEIRSKIIIREKKRKSEYVCVSYVRERNAVK